MIYICLMFNPVEIIKRKRNNLKLTKQELEYLIKGYLLNSIPDYQVSAFLMAVYFNGLDDNEIYWLTDIFIKSGLSVDLSHIEKPKVDKHSTGGVGDKTSLVLAPLLATFNVVVPMMSGRGLGHTGGTLDKLESIPGFRIDLSVNEFIKNLEEIGVCMIGQTDKIAPADKKFYALRDVTATVDSIGLISASIVSKKISEGSEAIVYDVKIGNGSTIPTLDKSKKLAKMLIDITKMFGRRSTAVLTNMIEPLGYAIGNYIEVQECIKIMKNKAGKESKDLIEVIIGLASHMLYLAGKSDELETAKQIALRNIENGKCYEKFVEMVKAQNGDLDEFYKNVNNVKFRKEIKSSHSGYIHKLDALKFGMASVNLGCGRRNTDDKIDYHAGIKLFYKVGDTVNENDIICEILSNDENKLELAVSTLEEAIVIKDDISTPLNKIIETIV